MNSATLVRAFAGREPVTWFFHVLTLALGAAIVLSLVLLEHAVSDRLQRDLAGINLVIGAKGSPSQLVLSALLQVDAPTGNISAAQAARFAAHPLVETAIPVSMGDSVAGARIVGTVPGYAGLFGATLVTGRWWDRPMEAVLGAAVAKRLGLAVGARFKGQHGLSGGQAHEVPYVVSGVLAPTGTTIDGLVLTDQQSIWAVHEQHDEEGSSGAQNPQEVTALLIRYRSAMAAVVLPRLVSETPDMQPAVPALEVARLVKLLGVSSSVLRWIGMILLSLAATGFVVALLTALGQRRREIALLRVVGAARRLIVALVAMEAIALGLIGGILGVLLSRLLLVLAAFAGRETPFATLALPGIGAREIVAVGMAVALAALASIPAAWRASRLDPAFELAKG